MCRWHSSNTDQADRSLYTCIEGFLGHPTCLVPELSSSTLCLVFSIHYHLHASIALALSRHIRQHTLFLTLLSILSIAIDVLSADPRGWITTLISLTPTPQSERIPYVVHAFLISIFRLCTYALQLGQSTEYYTIALSLRIYLTLVYSVRSTLLYSLFLFQVHFDFHCCPCTRRALVSSRWQ